MDFDHLELPPNPSPGKKATPAPSTSGSATSPTTNHPPLAQQAEPTDAASCFERARALRQNGRMGEAVDYYQRTLGMQEHHFRAWLEGVDCLIRAGRNDEALAWAQKAVDGHRQTRILYAALALAHAHKGDLAHAMKLSDISLDIERPDYPVTVRAEILLLTNRGSRTQKDLALECLEEAARLAVEPWEVFFVGGCALFEAGWPAHAAGYFAEAAHAKPMAAAGWLGLADAFHAMRLHEQAVFYCSRALEIDPYLQAGYQKQSAFRRAVFGLMRVFKQEELEARWAAAFKRANEIVDGGSFRQS